MTMTYTLAMASDQGIEIAKDGVAEVAMTKARAALTSLIREVRWGGRAGAFTERSERVALVVSPDAYAQAQSDRRFVSAFHEVMEALPMDERPQRFMELLLTKLGEPD